MAGKLSDIKKSDIIKVIENEMKPRIGRDDDRMYSLKQAVLSLPENEKRIMLLYIELGSFRDVGNILGVSQTAVWQVVKVLREKIKNKID